MSQEECTSTSSGMWVGLHEAFPNLVVYLDLSGTPCILSVWPIHLAFEAAHSMEHAASREGGSSHPRDTELILNSAN